MADLIKLTCPSCGSRLDSGEKANNFICPQCGNRYLFKQEGNSISLIPILEKMQKGSTVVLGDSASVVHAENVYMGGQAGEKKQNRALKKRSNARYAENSSTLRTLSDARIATDPRSAFRTRTLHRIFVLSVPNKFKMRERRVRIDRHINGMGLHRWGLEVYIFT